MKNAKVLHGLFALTFLVLPFGLGNVTTVLLVVLFGVTLISIKKTHWLSALKNPVVWASWAYYLWLCITLIYSNDIETGLRNLETKLSFLLGPPALLAYQHKVKSSQQTFHLKVFVAGNVLAFFTLLGYAAYRAWQNSAWFYVQEGGTYQRYFFTYETFSELLMHPGYLATYVGFALLSALQLSRKFPHQKLFWYGVVATLLLEMLLLQGRMNLIALVGVLFIAIAAKAIKQRAYKLIFSTVAGVIILAAAVYFLAPEALKDRYLAFPNFSYNISGDDFNSATYRLAEWHCAKDVIVENPWLGVGIGDAKKELLISYQNNAFWSGLKYRYNAHNQYLETMLAAGIVGLLLLLLILGVYAFKAYRQKNHLMLAVVGFTALCLLTESMFERAWAVILFNVFLPYFIAKPSEAPQKINTKRS